MNDLLDHQAQSIPLTLRSIRAIGTTATVVVQDPNGANAAERILRADLEAIDLACSRFRNDSELTMVHDHAGAAVRVSALLFHALEVAYSVAERTHGAVDPTVGNAINALGYDEDLSAVQLHAATPQRVSALLSGSCIYTSILRDVRCVSLVVCDWIWVLQPKHWWPTARRHILLSTSGPVFWSASVETWPSLGIPLPVVGRSASTWTLRHLPTTSSTSWRFVVAA